MGIRIEMEKKIDMLESKVSKLENVLNEILSLVKGENKVEQKKTKKTNNKGNSSSSRVANARKSDVDAEE